MILKTNNSSVMFSVLKITLKAKFQIILLPPTVQNQEPLEIHLFSVPSFIIVAQQLITADGKEYLIVLYGVFNLFPFDLIHHLVLFRSCPDPAKKDNIIVLCIKFIFHANIRYGCWTPSIVNVLQLL